MTEQSFGVRLYANISAYKAAMREAGQETGKFSSEADQKLMKVGKSMSDVGGKMTTRLTAPIVGAGVAASKMFLDFDSSMNKIQALVGLSAAEVDGMKDSVLALAGETSRSPQELADALFVVTSAGLRGSDALDTLEVAAKASAAGLGETETIARAVAGAVNAYGPDVLGAAKATDILTATARAGNFETSQLAGALGRVLPFAKQAGAGLEDVGGAVALLTRTNGNAAESITQISGLMRAFVVPTAEGAKILGDLGLSAADVRAKISEDGLVAALQDLDTRLDGNREQLGKLIGSSEGASAAFQILDADATTIADTFGATADSAGIVDEAFATVAESGAFQLKQSWAEVQASMIEAGEIIVPIVADIAGALAGLVGAFADLPPGAQNVVVGLLGILAVAGPTLVIAGKMVTTFGALRAAMASPKWGQMAMSTAALGPIGIAAAAGIALVAAAWYRTGDAAISTAEMVAQRAEDMAASVRSLVDEMDAAGSSTLGFKASLTGVIQENDLLRESMANAGVHVNDLTAILERGGSHYEMVDSLREITTAASSLGATDEEVDALFLSLRELARESNHAEIIFGELEATTEDLVTVVDASGKSMNVTAAEAEFLDTVLGRTTDSVDGNVASQEEMVAVTDANGNQLMVAASQAEMFETATEKLMEAQQAYIDSILASISTMFDHEASVLKLQGSYEDYTEAIGEHNETMADASASDEAKTESARELRLQEIALAEEALASAEAFATQSGAIDGSAESARLQIEELGRQREKYPELREEIDAYIGRLALIPGAVPTDVQALIDQGLYDEALRRLASLERVRTVRIRVESRGVSSYVPSVSYGSGTRNAQGGFYTAPTSTTLVEDGDSEVVLPVEKPGRLDALLSIPEVLGPVSASLARLSGATRSGPAPMPASLRPAASYQSAGAGASSPRVGELHMHNHSRPVTTRDLADAIEYAGMV